MSWLRHNLAGLNGDDHAEPIVSGIAYPGSRVLISGEPESLKSWLAAVVAVQRLSEGESVVWVDFEQGPAVTRTRFEALGVTDAEMALLDYIAPREPLEPETRAQLVEELQAVRPTLTVFDAYAGLLGVHDLDPDSSRDIERVNRHVVDVFRDVGSTVLILDHVVKAKDNRSRYSSGSGRKLAEVEVHIGLERIKHFSRGTTGAVRLRNHKDRLGGLPYPLVGELHLSSNAVTGEVAWSIGVPAEQETVEPRDRFRPTGLMERVSRYLELTTEPVSRATVESDVQGKGEYIRLAIDHLVAENFVEQSDGARNAKLVLSIRPFREADDLVPPRPDLVPTSSQDEPSDLVPRPLPIRQDEDEVMGGIS